MKCPYCCTMVEDNQRRCPICNADLMGYAPSPCDVIPDENDHCAVHDRYEPADTHRNTEFDSARQEYYDHRSTDLEKARQEYYEHHPKVKELAEGNPKYEAFVDNKLRAEMEERNNENGTSKGDPFKKMAEHPIAGFILAVFFVILIIAWTGNYGGTAPLITIVLLISGILSLMRIKKH